MTTRTLSGDYIPDISIDVDDPYNPVTTVEARFTDTLAKAETVYEMLIGDGSTTTGLLGAMQAAIASAPTVSVSAPTVDTALTFGSSGLSVPTFNDESLQTFPTTAPSGPIIGTAPTITTSFTDLTAPSDPSLVMSWAEAALPSDIYSALASALTSNLGSTSTGINATVEAAIYSRARTRQAADRLAEYNRINDTATELQFAMPSGVLASALADYGIGANRQDADIENNIIIVQAERAQANLQFSLQAAASLEGLIRQTRTDESGRALDYAKALAAETREYFAAKVQKYIAQWDGKKTALAAEAESLKGFIDVARITKETFESEYNALKVKVDSVAAANKSFVDVFLGRIQGFAEAEKAIASSNDVLVRHLAEKIKNAENGLRAAISQAEQTMAGYSSEQSITERMASDIAQIAAQVCASMLSAVHAGASISYSGTESSNQSVHIGATVNESHSAEHDPVT